MTTLARALGAVALLLAAAHALPAQETRQAAAPARADSAVGAWVALLGDRVPRERISAAYALAEIGPGAESAVPALRRTLGDEDAVVRYAAVWALSEIGPGARSAIPDLEERAARDPVGDVRWIAAKALRKLGVAGARPAPHAGATPPPG